MLPFGREWYALGIPLPLRKVFNLPVKFWRWTRVTWVNIHLEISNCIRLTFASEEARLTYRPNPWSVTAPREPLMLRISKLLQFLAIMPSRSSLPKPGSSSERRWAARTPVKKGADNNTQISLHLLVMRFKDKSNRLACQWKKTQNMLNGILEECGFGTKKFKYMVRYLVLTRESCLYLQILPTH